MCVCVCVCVCVCGSRLSLVRRELLQDPTADDYPIYDHKATICRAKTIK